MRNEGDRIITTDADEGFALVGDSLGKRLYPLRDNREGPILNESQRIIMSRPDPLLEGLPQIKSIPSEDELLGN